MEELPNLPQLINVFCQYFKGLVWMKSHSFRESLPNSQVWACQVDFSEKNSSVAVRMAMVNREAKRDVTVSKDALLKSYSKRLKDDVRSLADNFSAIVKTCRYYNSGMMLI